MVRFPLEMKFCQENSETDGFFNLTDNQKVAKENLYKLAILDTLGRKTGKILVQFT